MKQTWKRAIALLMTLALCLGLLPFAALAATEVRFAAGALTLYEDATVNAVWTYSPALPEGNYMPEFYAWPGTSTTMPEHAWITTASDSRTDGGSLVSGLYWMGDTAPTLTAGETCMVYLEVLDNSNAVVASYGPARATVAEGSALPHITSASYNPISTVLTTTFTTTDLDAEFFETYLLTKTNPGSSYIQDTVYIASQSTTYYQLGSMSYDASDAAHVTVNRDAGTVTLSQEQYFKDQGDDANYFPYPKPGDEIFVLAESENYGKMDNSIWSLTVPEAGSPGRVTATMTSFEPGTMTTDFGTTLTGNIATIEVTMDRSEGAMGFFVGPFNSQDMKASTGNMPSIQLEKRYNENTHEWEYVGSWEDIQSGNRLYEGPNGEKITATESTVTVEMKVCQTDSASQQEVVFAEGEPIVIYAQKGTKNMMVHTDQVKLEIPCSASSVGQTVKVDDDPSPTITTTFLPDGSTLSNYSTKLEGTATNSGTLTWSVTGLPKGLSVNRTTGWISGKPTQEGDFSVVVTLTENGVEKTATKTLSLHITGATPEIATATLTDATRGAAYSDKLSGRTTKGGALTWEVSGLPDGLTVNASTGAITGTSYAAARDYEATVTLREAGVNTPATKKLTLKMKEPGNPVITTKTLQKAKIGKPYSVQLEANASIGGALTWEVSGLPDGLTVNASTGVISGTPGGGGGDSVAGDYTCTVKLTETKESITLTAEKQLTLTVEEPQKYTVSYSLNGGKAKAGNEGLYDSKSVIEESTVTLPAEPERRGFTFTAWYCGGKTYQPRDQVTVNDNMYFSAQWEGNDPIDVIYAGELVGSVYLRGKYQSDDSTWYTTLDYAYYSEPTVPDLQIDAYDLDREYESVSLCAKVDGRTEEIATYDGDPLGKESIKLTPKEGLNLTIVDAIQVMNEVDEALIQGTDYALNYAFSTAGGWSFTLPALTTGGNIKVRLRGLETSENYEVYDWGKTYDATLSGSTLSATVDKVPDGLWVSGTVTFGTEPLAGVRVQLSQYVYGQNRNLTVVTDAEGKFTTENIRGFDESQNVALTVFSGDIELQTFSLAVTQGAEQFSAQPWTVAVTTAPVMIRSSVDSSGLTDPSAARAVTSQLGDYPTVVFWENDRKNYLAHSFWADGSSVRCMNADGPNSTIHYEVVSSNYAPNTGTFTLADGKGTLDLTLKPVAGAVIYTKGAVGVNLRARLAWFGSDGTLAGVSEAFWIVNASEGRYVPCPAEAKIGTFTVALIADSARGTLKNTLDESKNQFLGEKTWSVTLTEGTVQVLGSSDEPALILDRAAAENAAYVTKPNSTLTADRASFATENDLVRFTGSIGVDDSLEGKLTYLTITPKSAGVSYSNSAVLQCVVLDGKVYDAADFGMAGTGYYYKNFSEAIELPCEYTIYCKPGSTDWDMELTATASVTTTVTGGNTDSYSDQPIGSAVVKKPGAYITTLSSYVCDETVAVKGTALPDSTVYIYDGETRIASATADRKGLWNARVTLADTDRDYLTTHVLTSRTASGARSEDLYVFHDPNGPQLTSFRMAWNGNKEIDVGDAYTYAGGMRDLTFTAKFKHPGMLRATQYADGAKVTDGNSSRVAFVYYLTNGEVNVVYATQDDDTFTAKLDKTIYSSVAAAEVLYDPILTERPVAVDGDGVTTYALSATDLAEYAEALNAAQNATLSSNEVDLSRTANEDNLAKVNAGYAGTGMTVQAFAVNYDDETGFLQWMNVSAAEWTSGDPEENSVGIYNKSVVYANKADYDAQLAQLKAYATWQSALENSDSTVTGGQFFFTDMKYDGDLNLTDEGTYVAEFDAFCDTSRELYAITGALALDSTFRQYATTLPNNAATLTESSGSSNGDATLMWFWGNEGSKRDNVSTTEKAIQKYVQGGGIQKLFQTGPDPVGLYMGIKDTATEHIETKAQAEMQALGAKVDAGMIENSKEFQEVNNAKTYYDKINPFSSFRSSGYESDKPTIGDRIDQIKKDIEALKQIDGKLPFMDAKLGAELMKGLQDVNDLAGFLTGGASVDPTSPLFKFFQDIPGIVCDKMTMDQIQERMDIYNRMMYNWNYVQNWYNSEIGFGDERFAPKDETGGGSGGGGSGGGGETGGGVKDDTGTSSSSRAREIAEKSKTRKPPITNKVSNDPSGVVFEGVIENPVEGANVTLYYAATAAGDLVLDAAAAKMLVRADGVDELIPAESTQTTGADGRFQWGVPEGLWYVTADHAGYEQQGNSNADKAATVEKALNSSDGAAQATRLLPVLPVQLEVNIPLVSKAAPYVTDVVYAQGEGVYVTFSKYMQEGEGEASCLDPANYTVTVNGTEKDVQVSSIEQGHVPANLLPEGTTSKTYTRTVLLELSDLAVRDEVALTVKGGVKSYAGTPMGEEYRDTVQVGEMQTLEAPVFDPDGGEVERNDRVTIILPAGAPDWAGIYYTTDGTDPTTDSKLYREPIAVTNNMTIKAIVVCEGYKNSEVVTKTFTVKEKGGDQPDNPKPITGGGGAAPASNPVNVASSASAASHAKVTSSAASAKAGDKVTLTVTPDPGYVVENVVVKDAKGNVIPVTRNPDGTYTFVMPDSAVTVEPVVAAAAAAGRFVDVPKDAYYSDAVDWAVEKGVTNGTDETHFSPNDSCTRAQMVTFLWRAFGSPEPGGTASQFTDVVQGSYYEKAVAWAVEKGITKGVDETHFAPNATVTRGQCVTFLCRALDGKAQGDNPFTDVTEGAYYYDAVLWAVANGITTGKTPDTFGPGDDCTRAQIVTFLYRAMGQA